MIAFQKYTRLFFSPRSAGACAALLTLLTLLSADSQAQAFSIGWWSIDAGGGTSTAAGYSLTGTIAQTDAATSRGGAFTVTGGFWAGVELVQTPDAPELSITRDSATGTITISWPLPDDGWELVQSKDLGRAPEVWHPVAPGAIQSDATHRHFVITRQSQLERLFFRLQKTN